MVHSSAQDTPRSRQRNSWDALADIEVFIYAANAELEAMDAERTGVHRRGRKPDPDLRRRVLGLIWMLTLV
jgi:hypothetical protein